VPADEARRQLSLYDRPLRYARLLRPCTPGDGLVVLDAAGAARLRALWSDAVAACVAVKLVPASGAASRMFKTPLQWLAEPQPLSRARVRARASGGDTRATELEELLAGLPSMALWGDLARVMRRDGLDAAAVLEGADVRVLLDYLLGERGLGCADLPKALLPFHRYDGAHLTPIEEHLVEAAHYVRDASATCRVHFTVSEEHRERCRALAAHAAETLGRRFGVRYEIGFSVQKPSTDALAVDADGRPFRLSDGQLLLRPAGHGALLDNLADLDADVVFLKNIDNVVPTRLQGEIYDWKRVLAGMLVETQRSAFAHVEALEREGSETDVRRAMQFLADVLGVRRAAGQHGSVGERRRLALALLDRPLRVCGMVPNRGEAGGGPFWVDGADGETKQIVEPPQVDPSSSEQQALLRSAPHFNPVDLVCGLRDRRGRAYDLRRFVDESAYLVVEKSHEGRPLRSIERPGLWNGSMAGWNTIFVEVPLATFAPVKTVNDLLRPAHQAA
jgi:hypothetical protein